MQETPLREHEWLMKFVGEWTYESEATMLSGDVSKFSGTESVRSLGDFWIIGEGRGKMPDGDPATTIITLGYDPLKGKYVGTFVGSMMPNLWIYEGALQDGETEIHLDAEGPDMTDERKTTKYRDVVEWENNDHRILTSFAQAEDGQWRPFMTGHYRRVK